MDKEIIEITLKKQTLFELKWSQSVDVQLLLSNEGSQANMVDQKERSWMVFYNIKATANLGVFPAFTLRSLNRYWL